jgi:carboxypeptidase C (cathepsin A)
MTAKRARHLVLAICAIAALAGSVGAQERGGRADHQQRQEQRQDAQNDNQRDPQGVLRLLPGDSSTDKRITVGGKALEYTATAGTLSLYDQTGERSAAIYYTAYTLKGADRATRPVTFAFNGGPGAASVFLNLGLAGPLIADFGPTYDGAQAKLIDNPETWLAFTDLVFIDPVGTGWSRAAKSDGGKAFWSVGSDAQSLAKAVALYVAHNSRMASPKYLLGESYGGFRSAKVARVLQADQGIIVAGIVMVSPMIEAGYTFGGQQGPFTAALTFPSLVASELERAKNYSTEAMAEAERFALNEYLTTLAGPQPAGERAQAFYSKVGQMTGLPADVVAKSRGYVRGAYTRHLRSQGLQISSYDATFTIPDLHPDGGGRVGDPMLDGFVRALSGLYVGYAREELGFKTDITYILLNREINWDWGGNRDRQGASDDLSALLALDPSFRLLVAHGRSDLVTPYGVSRYLVDQIAPPAVGDRAGVKAYRGGHMFYFDAESRRIFTDDVRNFYRIGP